MSRYPGPLRENDDCVKENSLYLCRHTPVAALKAMAPLIDVKNLACLRPEGDPVFVNVNFEVNEGDIIILRARSGTGSVVFVPTRLMLITLVYPYLSERPPS